MTFKKGQSGNPAGRPAGIPNKNTAAIKEMIITALNNLGGADYLQDLATISPSAFASLVKAILPKDVNIGGQSDNELIVKIRGLKDNGTRTADIATSALSRQDLG